MIRKRNAAYALARAALGTVLLIDGMGSALSASLAQMAPTPSVAGLGTVLPFLEMTLGGVLLAGLVTAPALVPSGALVVVLTLATVLRAGDPAALALDAVPLVCVAALLWLESMTGWALVRMRVREDMGAPPVRTHPMPPLLKEPSRRWMSRRSPRDRA